MLSMTKHQIILINTKLICSRSHFFLLFMISSLKNVCCQFFEIFFLLTFFIVNGEDVVKAIKSSIPSTCDSSRRIVITSMQDSSQAQLLPFVQLCPQLLILTAVLKSAQKSIIGYYDAVHAQSTRPVVQGKIMIGLFSLYYSINQRKLWLGRRVKPHSSAFGIQFPSLPKLVPISTINVFLALSIVPDILLGLWKDSLHHQIQPILGSDISDCIRSEQSCNKGTEITNRVVVCYPSRLYRNRNQLIQIFLLVVVQTNASCPHSSSTSHSILLINDILPIFTAFAEFISRSHASHSWRSSRHIFHAIFVLSGKSYANILHFILLGRRLNQCFSRGNMHDCIVAKWKIVFIDVQSFYSFIFSDSHHVFMDIWTVFVELPITLLVAHRVSNCSQQHRGSETCQHILLKIIGHYAHFHTYNQRNTQISELNLLGDNYN